MKKHIVFDFDDTLCDSYSYSFLCYKNTIQEFNHSTSDKEILDLFNSSQGLTIDDTYGKAIARFNLDTSLQTLIRHDQKLMQESLEKLHVFDFVPQMLQALTQKGDTLHICTNRYRSTLIPILKHNNIFNMFETIISCKDEGYPKPNPKSLLDIIRKYGNNKSNFIYFGDSEVDAKFAKRAGIDFVIIDQYLNQKNFFKNVVNLLTS